MTRWRLEGTQVVVLESTEHRLTSDLTVPPATKSIYQLKIPSPPSKPVGFSIAAGT